VALERTFAIIKPDAVARNLQGEILSRIHKAGFRIVAIKTMILTQGEAAGFYAIHKERPFFGELCSFMCSGKSSLSSSKPKCDPEMARHHGRHRPEKSRPRHHSPRSRHSIGNNCTHGSDAPETAAFEIGYFFSGLELI